ncbi:MFS transporter, partial [Pseudonocardia sp. RS11V-5]|uniref:MFS transporter n=1 Tax=Pseudonocardia terrae TaxID=2905831 RepID=UPI001E415B04
MTFTLVALYVLNYADKAVLGLVAQPLSEELGLSSSQIGLIGSAFFAAFVFSGFFAGALTRWLALRWIMVILSLTWAASMLPATLFAGFAIMMASRIALGLFEGPSSAIIHTGVYSWHPPAKRALPGAFITSGSSIAKIALMPLLAVIVATWGWRGAFIALSAMGIAWCIVWLMVWREGPYGTKAKTAPAEPTDTPEPKAAVAPNADLPWWRIALTPTFIGGLLAVFAMYALVSTVLTWLPSYFEVGLGYSRLQAGVMFGFPSIVGVIALFTSTFISDRLMSRGTSSRVLRGILPGTGLLLCGVALTALPAIGSPAFAVAVVSLGYGVGSIVFPLINAAVSQLCPPHRLATTLGIFLALMALGGLVGPYLTGVVVDAAASPAEGYATAFQVFGVMALIGGAAAVLLMNPERDA